MNTIQGARRGTVIAPELFWSKRSVSELRDWCFKYSFLSAACFFAHSLPAAFWAVQLYSRHQMEEVTLILPSFFFL